MTPAFTPAPRLPLSPAVTYGSEIPRRGECFIAMNAAQSEVQRSDYMQQQRRKSRDFAEMKQSLRAPAEERVRRKRRLRDVMRRKWHMWRHVPPAASRYGDFPSDAAKRLRTSERPACRRHRPMTVPPAKHARSLPGVRDSD